MRRIACETCPARAESLVCGLPDDVLHDFRAAGTAMLYRPRQVLFGEDTPAHAVYLVCHGAVKLYHSDRSGRDHILEIAGPGALLGELSLGEDRMSVCAEAVTETQAACITREHLAGFLQRHPETALRILAALSRELALARRKVRTLALKRAESRLADLLLHLAALEGALAPGSRLPMRYARRELAEMIGVTTETVIRLLAALKRKGALGAAGRDLLLADPARLTRIARQDEIDSDASPAGA